jgi:hypothetical protein
MTDWIVNFTKAGAHNPSRMQREARALLNAGLWGIPATAPSKDKPMPGDRLLLFVGAPELAFVGDATIASSFHEWTPEELEVYPGTFDAGLALSDPHIYTTTVRLARIWSRTEASEKNPKGVFRSSLWSVPSADFELIAATGRR